MEKGLLKKAFFYGYDTASDTVRMHAGTVLLEQQFEQWLSEQNENADASQLELLVRRLAEIARRTHFDCEGDPCFNCPKNEYYIRDDGKTECECGADAINGEIDEIMKKLFPAA